MTIAAILLAAGQASRFGSPKLAASLGGRPVCTHVAMTLSRLPVTARIAVVGPQTPDLVGFGFDCTPLDPAGAPLSRSIALGVERAIAVGARAVLIALADMPLIPLEHFQALLDRFDGHAIGTAVDGRAMPPAVFGASLFPQLLALHGDSGAKQLLQAMPTVPLSRDLAFDIDTVRDLELAERGFGNGR